MFEESWQPGVADVGCQLYFWIELNVLPFAAARSL